ncbi:hypothetical protein BTHE_1463 [Bifidobacterium thermophilum]|nr:hypothetical protein BTHE_1463 [Bifidobacterium thermophilum]
MDSGESGVSVASVGWVLPGKISMGALVVAVLAAL